MTSDALNKNTYIKYDHRNLILELTHTKYILNDSLIILTKYYYDESGNRIRKMSYNTRNDSLVNDEVYSRNVGGKELAIYKNNSILEYPIYGLDMIGKLKDDALYFYIKDHLGSIRAVVQENKIISSQDYDAWGYLLENRVYESDESIFKFTSKERDEESFYDYFSARYYNSRIGRFNSFEPVPSSSFGWSGYVYCADNPLRIIDPTGEEWYYIYDDERSGSWKYFEDEPLKEIWSGRIDEKGNKIMEMKQGYKELLFFQGSELRWLMESGEIMRWAAVSGILDEFNRTQPDLQGVESVGPIPEGWWTVDPQHGHSIREAIYPSDIANWIRKFPGQGEAFINIYPTPDNPSYRVSGFSIHGGIVPGSIGCIDLMMGVGDFYDVFMEHNKSMLLNTKYSNFK